MIANWREFRQHEVTATEFIDGKEKDLQGIHEEVKAGSDELTKEKVGQLEVRISLMFYVLFIYNILRIQVDRLMRIIVALVLTVAR